MARRLSFRVGRRGAVLILFGVIFILLGVSLRADVPPLVLEQLRVALSVAPLVFWSTVFITIGAVGCANAFYPPGKDNYGFIAMAGLSYLWSGFLVSTWIMDQPPRGLVSAFIYATFGSALTIISGWPEVREERDQQ